MVNGERVGQYSNVARNKCVTLLRKGQIDGLAVEVHRLSRRTDWSASHPPVAADSPVVRHTGVVLRPVVDGEVVSVLPHPDGVVVIRQNVDILRRDHIGSVDDELVQRVVLDVQCAAVVRVDLHGDGAALPRVGERYHHDVGHTHRQAGDRCACPGPSWGSIDGVLPRRCVVACEEACSWRLHDGVGTGAHRECARRFVPTDGLRAGGWPSDIVDPLRLVFARPDIGLVRVDVLENLDCLSGSHASEDDNCKYRYCGQEHRQDDPRGCSSVA